MTTTQTRVAEAVAAGRIPDRRDAGVAMVEWALNPIWSPERSAWDVWCCACQNWDGSGTKEHVDDCLIPALGASILHEAHWYARRWSYVARKTTCGMMLTSNKMNPVEACQRPRGHDDGAHEPREGELNG